jgi:hypothetical protein
LLPKAEQGACGPTQVGMSRHPCWKTELTQLAVRLGCVQPRAAAVVDVRVPVGLLVRHACICATVPAAHLSNPLPKLIVEAEVSEPSTSVESRCTPAADEEVGGASSRVDRDETGRLSAGTSSHWPSATSPAGAVLVRRQALTEGTPRARTTRSGDARASGGAS